MLVANFSTARDNLKKYCDEVSNNGEIVIVTRKDEKNIVMVSLSEWNKIKNQADKLSKMIPCKGENNCKKFICLNKKHKI